MEVRKILFKIWITQLVIWLTVFLCMWAISYPGERVPMWLGVWNMFNVLSGCGEAINWIWRNKI